WRLQIAENKNGHKLHFAGTYGFAQYGHHTVRVGWFSSAANFGRGAGNRGAFKVDFRDHRRRPANDSWRQHYSPDELMREDPRGGFRSDVAARCRARRQCSCRRALRCDRGHAGRNRSPGVRDCGGGRTDEIDNLRDVLVRICMRPQEIDSPESDRWKLLGISPIQIFIYPASVSFHVTYSLFETDPCFHSKQAR